MTPQPVTAEDLYLYAMQLLQADEQTRLEEFLKQSPEARAELANVRGDLALLALSTEQHTPPALARQRLMKQMAKERKDAPATQRHESASPAHPAQIFAIDAAASSQLRPLQYESSRPAADATLPFRTYAEDEPISRSGFSNILPWAGWALAAGMALTAFNYYRHADSLQNQVAFSNAKAARATADSAKAQQVLEVLRSGAAQRFQLTKQNSQPIPSARVTYLAESGSLVFQGSNMDQLPPYKTYELWLIPAGEGHQPIPAGTFKPDERGYASVILPEMPKGLVAGTFGVTMEDDGGAQSPTLPILMIGS